MASEEGTPALTLPVKPPKSRSSAGYPPGPLGRGRQGRMWEASRAEPWGGGRKRPSPSQVGMGALGPRPELLRRRRCSPHPPPSPGRLPTERPHSLSRGRWTPCLFVWSQRPRRGAAPSSSSAPGPTPPPRPAPLCPRASH